MSDAGDGRGRVHVGSLQEVSGDEPTLLTVDGRPVAVVPHNGQLYAIQNECLHQGGPVGRGRVKGELAGDWPGPGERVDESFDEAVPAIACPWHGWEYDLRSGEHLGVEDIALETYEVIVEDGEVYLER